MHAETDMLNLFVQDRFGHGPHHALAALGYTDHETAGDAITWNLEYGYTLAGGTLLYGLAGTGFRAPDATDRYGFGGNPALEPERSRSIEAGLRHGFEAGLTVSVALFRNDIDDLIEFVTLSFDPFAGENRNVAEARIEGIEASLEYDAAPWHLRVAAIHQDPRNLDTGEVLYRRAEDSLTVSVVRSFGPLQLGLDMLAAGERLDAGFPEPVTLDAYVLANLTARWQVSRAVALTARIENLLDEQYELADGFNTPDRGVYVSLSYAPGGRPADALATRQERRAAATPGAYSASVTR
jgi:vitamin B12 transporter